MMTSKGAYPYADTDAAQMLLHGIQGKKREGISLRTLAKHLDYAQATVLSHMSNGRVPVPLERAVEIAKAVGIDPGKFFEAAALQRDPKAKVLLDSSNQQSHALVTTLELISGQSLDELNDEQKSVLREVVADPHPTRRWLQVAEMPLIALLRRELPGFSEDGLDSADLNGIVALLTHD